MVSLAWEQHLRDLYQHLQLADSERQLTRDIDESILHDHEAEQEGLVGLIHRAMTQFREMHRLSSSAGIYLYMETNFTTLLADPAWPETMPISPRLRELIQQSHKDASIIEVRDDPELYAVLGNPGSVLIAPLNSPDGHLLLLFLLRDTNDFLGSPLADPALQTSLAAVLAQLRVALRHAWSDNISAVIRSLWEIFLDEDLGPHRCFVKLARNVTRFFPDLGPLKLSPLPEVQILTVQPQPDSQRPAQFLAIRATTGDEHENTKVGFSDSICGLLMEHDQDSLPFVCTDPTDPAYADRYQNYLGAPKGKTIRTELAIRLTVPNGPTVGIVNFESEAPGAFLLHHRAAIMNIAPELARMTAVFEKRHQMNRVMHLSVAASTARYLEGLAKVFRHGVSQSTAAIRLNADRLKKTATRTDKDFFTSIENPLALITSASDSVHTYTNAFTENISGFATMGPTDLAAICEEIRSLALESLLVDSQVDISIDLQYDKRPVVFASRLLIPHLFSLIDNSRLSIMQRMLADPKPGRILMRLDEVPTSTVADDNELNLGWILTISDNGAGVTSDQLNRLRAFKPETRFGRYPGSGLGLTAAQRFMASIGGRLMIDGDEGEGFQLQMLFDAYQEQVHGSFAHYGNGGIA